jgi:hypothetical protein
MIDAEVIDFARFRSSRSVAKLPVLHTREPVVPKKGFSSFLKGVATGLIGLFVLNRVLGRRN